ncbi:hypothetical protein LOZ65_006276 [Ophidiomyces ophidiicola]|nr:hypothetical protein LOZ65_006276 [Ophidiomyces ophidiicola]
MDNNTDTVEKFCQRELDYLIVGAGVSGLILASRLSENPSIRVGVLEAGELYTDKSAFVVTPTGFHMMLDLKYEWKFKTEPQYGGGDSGSDMIHGKLVGGSSCLNHGLFLRGSPLEYNDWERLGNPGWNWRGLAPYFKRVEAFLPFEENQKTVVIDDTTKYSKIWRQAWLETGASETGISSGHPMGVHSAEPIADSISGVRANVFETYYRPIMTRSNLYLLPNALVKSVIFRDGENGKLVATGVQFKSQDRDYTCSANLEVIICCGTMMSPGILERSGIGSKSILDEFGIKTIVHNTRVGENLQDHSYSYAMVEFKDEPLDEAFDKLGIDETEEKKREWRRAIRPMDKKLSTFLTFEQASMGRVEAPELIDMDIIRRTPLLRKQYELMIRRIENPQIACYHHALIPFNSAEVFRRPYRERMNDFGGIIYSLSTPFSRGFVHIQSADPAKRPCIDPMYFEHPLDLLLLRAATRITLDFMNASSFADIVKRPLYPRKKLRTVKDYDNHAYETCGTFQDTIGTCAMAPREDGGVVDPTLTVYGTTNLRIVDASIIPLHFSGNTDWTVCAIAERAADIINAQRLLNEGRL